ncbi:hypothetical protein STEG23_014025 [Scotinomys teguina]
MQLKAEISILGVIDDYGGKNSSKEKRFSFLQGCEGEGKDESQTEIFGDSNTANKSVVWITDGRYGYLLWVISEREREALQEELIHLAGSLISLRFMAAITTHWDGDFTTENDGDNSAIHEVLYRFRSMLSSDCVNIFPLKTPSGLLMSTLLPFEGLPSNRNHCGSRCSEFQD